MTMKNVYALLILGLFVMFFGGIGLYVGWDRVVQGRASRSWPNTPGEITYSQINRTYAPATESRDSEFRYHPEIHYAYTVNDVRYEAERIAFSDPPGGANERGEETAQAVLARYPLLASVTVYYDPDDPATAVLEPGTSFGSITPLLVGGFMFPVGLAMLIFAIIHWRQLSGG